MLMILVEPMQFTKRKTAKNPITSNIRCGADAVLNKVGENVVLI
jgi:hypothetical protein